MTAVATIPQPGQLAIGLDSFRDVVKKPLRLLPETVRPAALRAWVCNRHLAGLETALPLAARLSAWIEEHGLRPDDAADLLLDLLSPEASMKHRFASDLLADLAGKVSSRIGKRRTEAEVQRRRSEPPATPRAEIDRLLASIGTSVNDPSETDVPARPIPADPALDLVGSDIPF